MITILLADDHNVVRQGLRALLETQPDFEILGEVDDGLRVMKAVRALKPDVIVLDLMLPGLNGMEVTRRVHKKWPQTAIVILSMYDNEAYVLESLRNGASAYVLKGSGTEELMLAIRNVAAGEKYLCPQISQQTIDEYMEKVDELAIEPYESLSTREREVFQLSAEGCINSEIAKRLAISKRTVESHRLKISKKLNLKNHSDLVCYAVHLGIIHIEYK